MKERFKAYLEEQFRQIAPTKAAMEYRKSMLIKMMDRAQELRIKGMQDDELIYNAVIAELGDFSKELRDYENKTIKREVGRKALALGFVISAAYIVTLVVAYLIVGFAAHIWHPTWLIIVGGLLVAISAALIVLAVRVSKTAKGDIQKGTAEKANLIVRGIAVVIEILLSVTLFLVLQLGCNIQGSWMTFLAMVALVLGVDTALAFAGNSKLKWIELPVFVEAFSVMLYVILGIGIGSTVKFWHPGWLICLAGFAVAIAECVAVLAKRTREKKKEEIEENTLVDESYWTKWDD